MRATRRQFLRFGGMAAGALLLGGCSDDMADDDADASDHQNSASPAPPPTPAPTVPPLIDDMTMARTAASLEALAVAAYGAVQSIGLVEDELVLEVARLHGEHHEVHLDELNGIITQAGGPRYTTPNEAVQAVLVDPVLTKPRLAEADIVKLAFDLEAMVAQVYTFASGTFSTPTLRSTSMTIGAIEARHAAAIGLTLMGHPPAALFPTSLGKTDNPLPPGAWITA